MEEENTYGPEGYQDPNKVHLDMNLQETSIKKRRVLGEIDDLIDYPLRKATNMYHYPDENDEEMPNKTKLSMIKRAMAVLGEQRDIVNKEIINYILKTKTTLYNEYRYAILDKLQDIEELFNLYFREKTAELVLVARAAGKEEMTAIYKKEKETHE